MTNKTYRFSISITVDKEDSEKLINHFSQSNILDLYRNFQVKRCAAVLTDACLVECPTTLQDFIEITSEENK